MNKPPAIVLHTPLTVPERLEQFVKDCLVEGITLIAIHGKDCDSVEDLIDWIVIDYGSQEKMFITTSTHRDEPIGDVLEFAAAWDGGSAVREVNL